MTWERHTRELKNEGREEGCREGLTAGLARGRHEGRNEARSVFKLFYTGSNPSEIATALVMKENDVKSLQINEKEVSHNETIKCD